MFFFVSLVVLRCFLESISSRSTTHPQGTDARRAGRRSRAAGAMPATVRVCDWSRTIVTFSFLLLPLRILTSASCLRGWVFRKSGVDKAMQTMRTEGWQCEARITGWGELGMGEREEGKQSNKREERKEETETPRVAVVEKACRRRPLK